MLAESIDSGIPAFRRTALPADRPVPVRYYPEMDTYRMAGGSWRMDVCGYDFAYRGEKHISGGCITLLWEANAGALLAAGLPDQTLLEPHNQQPSVHPETWRSGCPRLETRGSTPIYGQQYCDFATLTVQEAGDDPAVRTEGCLCSKEGQLLPGGAYTLEYRLSADGLFINGSVDPALIETVCYVLPLIKSAASVRLLQGQLLSPPEDCFNLCPGFLCSEYRIRPDRAGRFRLKIIADTNTAATKTKDPALA